ncbi:homoserine dehydrogenase [Candidatus Epulonipiscium viviparus]|uniref:homoserine dehydrogenase n=1 Tax=Candidatus Epulonipiscium viviparus TaxID=420336 RepID=UPI002738164D|nr:homoserine dehydrogenase [Candidatus Epulopiscium viviparus]
MIKIAILGCGTVGGGVYKLIQKNSNDIKMRTGKQVDVKWVLEKDVAKAKAAGVAEEQITQNIEAVLADAEVQIVVELMGGLTFAYDCIVKAIKAGKNIVTANKDLIAVKGEEIFVLAKENGVDVHFEASVGGGIPVIGAMQNVLCANMYSDIVGILNGTTNYILTKMTEQGISYQTALAQASELGYAEANPSSDVEGTDAARKIAILASIAFNSRCTLDDVYQEGITQIIEKDITLANKLGYQIKLVAMAKERDEKIILFVRPAFVKNEHPLAAVNDVFNAVFLKCDAADEIMLYGRGAGEMPTASSVVGDIMAICTSIANKTTGNYGLNCYKNKEVLEIGELLSSFCLRLRVEDKPNVLAGIASELGKRGVSIASVIQSPVPEGKLSSLTIITHETKEKYLQEAIVDLKEKEYVKKANIFMCLG